MVTKYGNSRCDPRRRIAAPRLGIAVIAAIGLLPLHAAQDRPRARDLGIAPGALTPGPHNAITDVAGVGVGHTTIVEGDSVRTGVTAILPHEGNLFREKVPGAVFIGNAFGKLAGSTQVQELGTIESPIVLTNTLSVGAALDAVVRWTLDQPGNENVRSVNGLVGETNDGGLNDIRGLHVTREHVFTAIRAATTGPVAEGAVGAGTGTIAFGWKGGIGTSSRVVTTQNETWTVGVLVQSNYGGQLTIHGVPVWRELRPGRALQQGLMAADPLRPGLRWSAAASATAEAPRSDLANELERVSPRERSGAMGPRERASAFAPKALRRDLAGAGDEGGGRGARGRAAPRSEEDADGSCMIVVATDAPLDARNLERLAARAIFAMARTGSTFSNGSGDFAIAFSTHPSLRVTGGGGPQTRTLLPTDAVSPLFTAVLDATEEAIYNSLLRATDTTGNGRTVRAIPVDELTALLRKYGR